MALTTEQIEERRKGVAASDVAAIVRMHPYKSIVDVTEEKRGLKPPEDMGPRVRWGNLLEAPIRDDYAERHGVTVTVPGVLTHPTIAHHKATPDGLVWYRGAPRADRGLEIKTHTVWLRGGYGEPGSDEVPLHELVQCAWNMHVTGLDRWDLVAFIDGLPIDYVVPRDMELEEGLVEQVDRYWRDVIVRGGEPAPDGTERYEEYLREKFKESSRPGFRQADEEILKTIVALKDARLGAGALEADIARLGQLVKAFVADHEGVEFPALAGRGKTERITYRKSKDGSRTDHAAVAADLVTAIALLKSSPVVDALADVAARWGARFTIEGKGGTYTGADLLAFIAMLRGVDPEAIITAHTTPVIGPRVFNCPRNWKGETA